MFCSRLGYVGVRIQFTCLLLEYFGGKRWTSMMLEAEGRQTKIGDALEQMSLVELFSVDRKSVV